jgi:hypothetical protein
MEKDKFEADRKNSETHKLLDSLPSTPAYVSAP